MGLPFNIDTASPSQLVAAVGASDPESAQGLLEVLRRRYGTQPVPVFGLGYQPAREEWLQQVRDARAFQVVAVGLAGVGAVNILQLFNPATSKVRLLVYAVWWSVAAAQEVVVQTDSVDLNLNLLTATAQILSVGTSLATQAKVNSNQGVAPAGNFPISRLHTGANTPTPLPTPLGYVCELLPGQGLDVFHITNNSTIDMNIAWAEVPSPGQPGQYP